MSQIKKSLLGLLALLVVAGAVGGIALWTQKDEAAKTEAKEKSEKLFDFDKAHARSLRLEKDGKLVAALSKDEKGWKLDQPIKAESDDSAVDSLLSSLSSLKQKKDLADEKDLKAYGLDAPRLAVMVKLDDGKEQGLLLGVDNSFDNTLYVKKSGDATVRIVDGYNKNTFDKSLLDLRNKKVAHLDDSAEVKRVEVSGVKNPYVLEKDGANWKVGGAPADSGAADRVVSAVKQLRGTSVSTENGSIDKPKVTVKLSVTAGKDTFTRTVLIAQKDAKTYARRDDSPTVFEIDQQGGRRFGLERSREGAVRPAGQDAGPRRARPDSEVRLRVAVGSSRGHADQADAARRRFPGREVRGGRTRAGEEVEDVVGVVLDDLAARGGVRRVRPQGPQEVRLRQDRDFVGRKRQGPGADPGRLGEGRQAVRAGRRRRQAGPRRKGDCRRLAVEPAGCAGAAPRGARRRRASEQAVTVAFSCRIDYSARPFPGVVDGPRHR